LKDGAPPPDKAVAWVHLGASLACSADNQRLILASDAMAAAVAHRFKDISGQKLTGAQAGVGEVREALAAGYPRFFGMAGYHRYFHTPADRAPLTSPELLEPVARSFTETIDDTLALAR